MELKELYQADKTLFSTNVDQLKAKLLESGWAPKDVGPLIKVLETGLMDNDLLFVGDSVHVSTFNTLSYRASEKAGISWDEAKVAVAKILEATGRKIEGSPLDVLNPPIDDD